jgi:hypothetical protein
MRFADQPSTINRFAGVQSFTAQLIRNARKQEDRHHLFLEPSLPFPVSANDGSSIVRKRKQLANGPRLDELIREFRGRKVILDTDLARIYGIPTFRFNEAVKRNRKRVPEDFMFQLTGADVAALTSQLAISKKGHGGRRTCPRTS